MPQGDPKNGEFYRHFKDKLYQIITTAKHSETGEDLVIYQALYDGFEIYARPANMFISEVDHNKYPDVVQKYRFELHCPGTIKTAPIEETVSQTEENMSGLHPKFVAFLDAETLEERYNLIQTMEDTITDGMLDSMAVVLDIVVPEGPMAQRYAELKKCIQTLMKYQLSRP